VPRDNQKTITRVSRYLETTKMLADLGTKALDPKQFGKLRNEVCGYSPPTKKPTKMLKVLN
jgi:hypothetical protein